jgi:hypothetical protein
MSAAPGPTRWLMPTAAAACVVLAVVQLGALPLLRHAWALNLWQYLPQPVALCLAALLLGLCWASLRGKLAPRLPAFPARSLLPETALGRAAFVAGAALVLWLLRERRMYGDSDILLYNAASGSAFVFPDIGASFLFHVCQELGAALGTSGRAILQPAVALAGGVTLLCFARVATLLAPGRRRALLFVLLVLGGGLLRVLAGHVEVYAFVLLCAGAYFWCALEGLAGRRSTTWAALTFGIGLWMHLSFSFLAPSLLVVVLLAPGAHGLGVLRRLLGAALVGAAPVLLFLVVMHLCGRSAELAQAGETFLRWGGFEPSPVGHEAFLRSPFGTSGAGTRYAILSSGHLKYLGNALFLLAPAALPMLAVLLVFTPGRFVATPQAVFLSSGGLFMLLYALVVRPVWGPYDWDLFSLTAVTLASLAAHLLVQTLPEPPLGELAVLLVGATLLLVTVPFVAIGIAPAHDAGPFAYGLSSRTGESPVDAFERQLGPWL